MFTLFYVCICGGVENYITHALLDVHDGRERALILWSGRENSHLTHVTTTNRVNPSSCKWIQCE